MKEALLLWNTGTRTGQQGWKFILCRPQVFKTHIKNTAVFMHEDDQVEVTQGQFTDKESDVDLTRLESERSYLQVKASMTMKEMLRQVRNVICVNQGDSPYQVGGHRRADNP
jgi:hypothetical protein